MSDGNKTTGRVGEAVAPRTSSDEEILKAVRNVKFGSVEITIHDSKVVQVERREKIRFQDQK
jgi:hypothetical protein